MDPHEEMMLRLSDTGAKKVCAIGECSAAYTCDHANHVHRDRLKYGSDTICPLAKYDCKPEDVPKTWYRHPHSKMTPTAMELWAICPLCPHAEVEEEEYGYRLIRRDKSTACQDCPVLHMEDKIS